MPHDLLELELRIIDQCRYIFLFRLAKRGAEFLLDLALDCPGSVSHDMLKLIIFAVHIRDKMLCPFRQTEDRAQINDLRRCRCDGRILSRQTSEVT